MHWNITFAWTEITLDRRTEIQLNNKKVMGYHKFSISNENEINYVTLNSNGLINSCFKNENEITSCWNIKHQTLNSLSADNWSSCNFVQQKECFSQYLFAAAKFKLIRSVTTRQKIQLAMKSNDQRKLVPFCRENCNWLVEKSSLPIRRHETYLATIPISEFEMR